MIGLVEAWNKEWFCIHMTNHLTNVALNWRERWNPKIPKKLKHIHVAIKALPEVVPWKEIASGMNFMINQRSAKGVRKKEVIQEKNTQKRKHSEESCKNQRCQTYSHVIVNGIQKLVGHYEHLYSRWSGGSIRCSKRPERFKIIHKSCWLK